MDPRPSMYSSPSYCTFLWCGLLLSYKTTRERRGCSEVLARITSKKNMLQLAEMFLMLFFRGIGIAKRFYFLKDIFLNLLYPKIHVQK